MSEAQSPRIYSLEKWSEARGIFRYVNVEEGKLGFDGFAVRIPSSVIHSMSRLSSLIGCQVSILRTDSASQLIIQKDDGQDSPTRFILSPSAFERER